MPQICDNDDHEVEKMSSRPWLAVLPLMLVEFSAAQSQTTVDVAKITCDQFVSLDVAPPDTIAIWLNGYHHGLQGKTIVDAQKLKDQVKDIMSYCLYQGKGGTVTIMEAAEKLLTPNK
jgi:hypothetical protein